ncbi:MAG: hypothetical protein ACOH1Y_06100 [Propionicimonas sp.]
MTIRPAHPRRWIVIGTALLSVLLASAPLDGNLRYEVGVHRASTFSVVDTFSHRPLTFRVLTAAVAWLPTMLSGQVGGGVLELRAFETAFRGTCLLAAVIAALVLGLGLQRRAIPHAWAYALAAYAALAFIAPATGEPDWWAPLFAVAAVGVGLFARPWLGGSIAGTLLALCALVKISSLPIAVAGLLILLVLDRKRGIPAGLGAIATGLVMLGAIALWAPEEIRWLLDIRALQPDPWSWAALTEAQTYAGNIATRWPTIALIPAYFVGASRRQALTAAAALALIGLGIVFQGQYYLYHAAALVTLSAILAVRTISRGGVAQTVMVAMSTLWTLWLFTTPAQWRIQHELTGFAVTAGSALAFVTVQVLTRRASPPSAGRWAAVLVAATLLATQTPISAEYFSTGATSQTTLANLDVRRDEVETATRIHRLIGTGTPVTYLTFGDSIYTLGNPTTCRYPSPLFLQRPGAQEKVSPATFAENLACVSEPSSQWLIWNRDWLHRKGADPDLLAAIDQHWACEAAFTEGGYTICPLRSQP